MRWLTINGLLLALIAAAIVGVQLLNPSEAAVEGSVRRYATAISTANLDAAVEEIAPSRRAEWTDWVRGQLGNVYDIRGIAVRSPSIVQRTLSHAQAGPFEVSVAMDVNRDYPDDFYQPTARVKVDEVDGRWYLDAPLLANE